MKSSVNVSYCPVAGFFFLTWTIFKDFFDFVTILLLFYVLAFWPQAWVWDFAPQPGSEPAPLHWKAKL